MLAVKSVPMTEACGKCGLVSRRRTDNNACMECARQRSKRQHQEVRANVVKWAEFQQRMREYNTRGDDVDWHKKPAEVPLDKVSRRFRNGLREIYGISRKQAAADLRLLRIVRREIAEST